MLRPGEAPRLVETPGQRWSHDSVVNVVTPLNSYVLVVLAVYQRYRADAGIGTLAALMAPYAAAFGIAWTALLLAWAWLGIDLGPGAPLLYAP